MDGPSSTFRSADLRRPWRRWLLWFVLAASMWLLARLLTRSPSLAEDLYGRHLGPLVSVILARGTGWLPFSVAELLIAAFLGRQLLRLGRALGARPRRAALRRLGPASGAVLGEISLAIALFFPLWGFHYARPSLEERLHWRGVSATALDDSSRVLELASQLIDSTNELYRLAHGSEDLGRASEAPPPPALEAALRNGWAVGGSLLGLPASVEWNYGRPKPLLISPILHRLGLSGFYFPFTGEANFNRTIPDVSLPQTLGHEQAHQRGFAPEDEASFVGFVVGAASADAYVRYSAHLYAQRQVLRALLARHPTAVRELLQRRLPGVQRDVDAQREYWMRARGPAERMATRVNDLYLRSHRVEGGVHSYSGSAELIVRWTVERGGTLPGLSPAGSGPGVADEGR